MSSSSKPILAHHPLPPLHHQLPVILTRTHQLYHYLPSSSELISRIMTCHAHLFSLVVILIQIRQLHLQLSSSSKLISSVILINIHQLPSSSKLHQLHHHLSSSSKFISCIISCRPHLNSSAVVLAEPSAAVRIQTNQVSSSSKLISCHPHLNSAVSPSSKLSR